MTTDHRKIADRLLFPSGSPTPNEHLLAAIHDGQAEQTEWLRDMANSLLTLRHDNEHLMRTLDERLPSKGDPCPCGCRRDVEPKPAHRAPCVAGEHCGEAAHCPPTDADPVTVPTRISDTALAVADALEDAARQVDDDKARQTLVRLADEWRAEADDNPEPESVTVTLPLGVVSLAWARLDVAAQARGVDAGIASRHAFARDALADALDAANPQEADQ